MSVTWNYNGTTTLVSTMTGAVNGDFYYVSCTDPDSTRVVAQASSGTLAITVNDIGGAGIGDTFGVYFVHCGAGSVAGAPGSVVDPTSYEGTNVFTYGTSSTTGTSYDATWTYDGSTAQVDYVVATAGITFNLSWYSDTGAGFGQTSDVGPFTVGTSHSLSISPSQSGENILVELDDTLNGMALSNRLFVGGSANSGFSGNPEGAGGGSGGFDGTASFATFSAALSDGPLVASPTWTQLGNVNTWSIDRGRRYELDKTQTGTAQVMLFDTTGVLDPTSGTSVGLEPMTQAKIELTNPATSAIECLFRGHVQDVQVDMDLTETYSTVTVSLVDGFDLIAALDMTPGVQGDTPPTDAQGDIYFDGHSGDSGPYTGTTDNVLPSDRIRDVLDDLGWPGTGLKISPSNLRNLFSGNIALQDNVYARFDTALSVIFDTADAEFPGVANFFMDKKGIATFHGRFARFDPNNYGTYGIVTWNVADTAGANTTDTPVISGLTFNRGTSEIINAVLALPQGVDDTDVPGALKTDSSSITTYGRRSENFTNLLVYKGEEQSGRLTAVEECELIATYYTDNYSTARTRVNQIVFRTQPASNTAWWNLVCGIDIGHVVNLTTTHPGGGGFAEAFFVEGIHYTAEPLNDSFPDVTLTLDLSPQAFYTQSPFTSNDSFAPPSRVSRAPQFSTPGTRI